MDDQAEYKDVEKFPFDIVTDNGDDEAYSARIFRAYIWELSFVDELNLIGNLPLLYSLFIGIRRTRWVVCLRKE